MKRLIICTLLILLCFNQIVFAEDLYENIISGKQDAFVIGKLLEINAEDFRFSLEKAIMGEMATKEFVVKVSPDFKITGMDISPKPGDYVAISISLKGEYYVMMNGCFLVEQPEDRNIKVLTTNNNPISKKIEQSLNNGEFIIADKRNKEERNALLLAETARLNQYKTRVYYEAPDRKPTFTITTTQFWIIGIVVLLSIGIIFMKRNRDKRKRIIISIISGVVVFTCLFWGVYFRNVLGAFFIHSEDIGAAEVSTLMNCYINPVNHCEISNSEEKLVIPLPENAVRFSNSNYPERKDVVQVIVPRNDALLYYAKYQDYIPISYEYDDSRFTRFFERIIFRIKPK